MPADPLSPAVRGVGEHPPEQPSEALEAVIFDVDGTLVDSERMGHRVAFNEAFACLGLPDRWTVEQYGELLKITGGRRRIATYFLQRGLDPVQSVALADELHTIKTALVTEMARNGSIPLRPGVRRLVGSLQRHGVRMFVATTGQPHWVEPLLELHFGRSTFERVLTGADVRALKPDPEVYRAVVQGARLAPSKVVAVEDSGNGLRAAHGAGIPCLVVANEYTGSDVADAELVVSGFGPHATPLYGGSGPLPHGLVTLETIASVAGRVPPGAGGRTGSPWLSRFDRLRRRR
ncbi:HAD superfamily hydrolase (TIGR01509 family) [Marmoricola sp. URHA0025 HA25]